MKQLNVILSVFLALFLSANQTFAVTATKTQIKTADGCETIVLKTGDLISVKVIQISPTEVKYKRCGKPNDPEIILPLSKVLKIIDAESIPMWSNDKNGTTDGSSTGQKVNGLALTSMISGIISVILTLFGGGWLTGALAIIFGSIGLYKITHNPEKWRGKGMAITGLVTGIAALVILALLILALL